MAYTIGEVAASPLCASCNEEALWYLSDREGNLPKLQWVAEVMVGEMCACCAPYQWPWTARKTKRRVLIPEELVVAAQACAASRDGKNYNAKIGLARKIETVCTEPVTQVYQREIYGQTLSMAMTHTRTTLDYGCLSAVFVCLWEPWVHVGRVMRRSKASTSTECESKPEASVPTVLSQEADEDGIIHKKGMMPALSMKSAAGDGVDRPAPQLCTPPAGIRAEHWADSDSNLALAHKKRYKDAVRPCSVDEQKQKKLRKCMDQLCGAEGPFAKQKILDWASKVCEHADLQPGSWDGTRFERAVDQACCDTDFRFRPSFAIKDEVLEDVGKNKPRFLIADGDQGQIASKFVIKCFGSLWYKWRTGHHIKYMDKPTAMMKVAYALRQEFDQNSGDAAIGKDFVIVEGDGSAWDSSISLKLKNLTENALLWHIWETLYGHALYVDHLRNARETIDKEKTITLTSKTGTRWVIDNIRRSGDAGTSDLNGAVNAMLWAFVLTPEPFRFLQGHRVCAHFGQKIHIKEVAYYEGDDSILRLPLALKEHSAAIEEAWKELGFNMKLFFRENEPATFTGYDFQVVNGRTTGLKVPTIWRNVVSSCYSVSTRARLGWRDGAKKEVHAVGRDAFLARAVAYEHDCPPLANAFLCLAEHHNKLTSAELDPLLIKHKGVETTLEETATRIRSSAGAPTEEQRIFWASTIKDTPLSINKLQNFAAFSELDPYGTHFVDLASDS